MALTNSQYDTIMRGYDRRQYENYRRQCARTDEIYKKFPRIREIQEAMSACSIRQAERLFDEEPDAKASAGVVVFTQSALRDRAEGKNGEK